jgi:hypothetical protein
LDPLHGARTRQFPTGDRNAVADEVNTRYQEASFSSFVITPEDALAVTEHLKRWIGAKDSDWFGPDQEEDG